MNQKTTIIFPTYHYLARTDEFKRIWGHEFELFKEHVAFYKKQYPPISVDLLIAYLNGEAVDLPARCSVITFDDSLKEHATLIAPYLSEQGISGLFNITACVLRHEPLNPQVIHFAMAYFGVRRFVGMVKKHFAVTGLNPADYLVLESHETDIMKLHGAIKKMIKYDLDDTAERLLLLAIWQKELLPKFPDLFERIHHDETELKQMVGFGHSIGLHSDTHALINDETFNEVLLQKEIIGPKQAIENVINKPITFFAYPYSAAGDVVTRPEYIAQIRQTGLNYLFASLEQSMTKRVFDPNFIVRYNSMSADVLKNLETIIPQFELTLPL